MLFLAKVISERENILVYEIGEVIKEALKERDTSIFNELKNSAEKALAKRKSESKVRKKNVI